MAGGLAAWDAAKLPVVSVLSDRRGGQFTGNPFQGKFGVEYGSALPRIKDNKTIGVTDEDAPEESCGQQSIFPGG